MKIAMLGCGYVANMYRLTLPLHPQLKLVGVTDLQMERARAMAAATGSRVYDSLEALLADPEVELVLNLTNPRSHYATTRRCLEAGRHVFTEKPLALDMAQATELVELAERRSLQLSSAPTTLLNEAAQSLWKAVRDNVVGPIRLIYAEMDDGMVHRMPVDKWINEMGTPWPVVDEFETGCTLEHAGYVLSWLAAMFGPARSVTAFSDTLVPDKLPGQSIAVAPDFSVGAIKFESGAVARLTCGIYAPVDHRLRLFGDEGVLSVADPRTDRSPIHVQRYLRIRRALKLMPWRRRYPLLDIGKKQVKYRGSQSRDFCSGLADMAAAIAAGEPCRLNARFCLHVNEMVLALHGALTDSRTHHMRTTFKPIKPMPWAE